MRDARAQAAVAAAVLLGLIAGVHHQVVFERRSLIHSNHSNPIDWRPLAQNYGPAMIPHDEWTRRGQWPFPNIRDPGATWWQWEPSTEFLEQAIADREWPLWDPYVAAGTPAMANLVQAFFFPPYLALVALGATVALKNAYFLALLWSASFVTYLFLRRHDLGFVAGLSGAVFVAMSGALNQNLGAFAGQTIACLPFTLYATRSLLDRPDRRRAALVAVVYAATALASFPPILVGVFGVTALYAACGILGRDGSAGEPDRAARAVWWSAGTALSAGLVAFLYLPAFALRSAVPQVAEAYRAHGIDTVPLFKGLQLLSPTIAGGVQLYWNDPFFVNGAANIPYVGVVVLVAASLARPGTGRQRSLFWTGFAATAVILSKLFGLPPIQWIGHLPFLHEMHFSHYLGLALGVPLACLAAIGVERVRRGAVSAGASLASGAGVVALLYLAWRVAAAAGVLAGPTASLWRADWNVLVAIAAAAIVGLAMIPVARERPRALALALLVAAATVEGFYNNTYLQPKRWDMFAHPAPYVRVLQAEAGLTRVFPFGVPAPNVNEAYGIFSLASVMALNPPRVYDLYRAYAGAPEQVFLRDASRIPPEGVLDRANVGFVGTYVALDAVVQDAERRGYESRFTDGFFTLYRRPTLPRFFFSSAYRVVPRDEALRAVASAPSSEIVLESAPPFASAANRDDDPAVRVESYRRNRVTVAVEAPRPGLVYAAESFFDGWSATVNGRAATIMPANYAFRAVAVPAGAARVEFRYWPPGLSAGLAVSGLSVLALAALAALPRRS
jgi:Bacterial membrane protein YfhO